MHPPTALLLATGPESNARKITEYDDVQVHRSIPNFVLLLDGGIMRVSIISICWYDFLFPLFSSSLCITSYKLILGGRSLQMLLYAVYVTNNHESCL